MDENGRKVSELNDIETLADTIKNKKLSPVKKQILQSKLASILLKKINLGQFSDPEDGQENIDAQKSSEELRNFANYNSKAFAKAFKSSFEKYGMRDKKTDKLIPFIQIFLSHYSLKKRDIQKDRLEEQAYVGTDMQKDAVKLFLENAAKKHNLPVSDVNENVKNVLNYNKANQYLIDIGATEDELENFYKVFYFNYVQQDEQPAGKEGDGISYASDKVAPEQYSQSTVILLNLTDNITRALSDDSLQKDPTLKKYVKYFIYSKILLYLADGNHCLELEEFLDDEFKSHFKNYAPDELRQMDVYEMIAAATGNQLRTVTKKRKDIENFLLKIYSRK